MTVTNVSDLPLVDVISVKPLENWRLELSFEDGRHGIYDVKPLLDKGVFKKLQDIRIFNSVTVEYGTAVWPGEIDIAPETLWLDCVPCS